jgi:hypothetical protein
MTWRAWFRRCLALCGLAALAVVTPGHAQERPAIDADRQILVMLKMAPPHYRPGANYGGSYGDAVAMAARRRLAAGIAKRNGLILVDGWPMPLIGVDCYVMRLPDGMAVDAAIARVSKEPGVAWSQPLQTYQARGSPVGAAANDPLFRAQPAATAWRLADLHRIATGRNVSIAIIDSKIDVADESLQSLPARVYIAPGRDGPTTQPGGKWYLVNGSSYAVAHVTGLIALMRQSGGRATRIALDRMADGAIDACATLVGASPRCDCSCAIDRRLGERPR